MILQKMLEIHNYLIGDPAHNVMTFHDVEPPTQNSLNAGSMNYANIIHALDVIDEKKKRIFLKM